MTHTRDPNVVSRKTGNDGSKVISHDMFIESRQYDIVAKL